MKTIKLLCAAGTSTQVLADKVRELINKLGLELEVSAAPLAEAEEACKDADLLLLTPQIEFQLALVQKTFPDKKVDVIDFDAFADADAEAVIAQINRELNA